MISSKFTVGICVLDMVITLVDSVGFFTNSDLVILLVGGASDIGHLSSVNFKKLGPFPYNELEDNFSPLVPLECKSAGLSKLGQCFH